MLLLTGKVMQVSTCIDWISATIMAHGYEIGNRTGLIRFIQHSLPKPLAEMNWTTTKAYNGYNIGMRSETGVLVFGHNERMDMGIHVIMNGSTIRANSDYGYDIFEWLEYILIHDIRIGRIDYAVDAINSFIEITDLANDIENNRHTSKARSAEYRDDKIRGGKTQYVGSTKNRTKLFRAYEKDVQMNQDIDWKRFEIELHGRPAKTSAVMAQYSPNFAKTVQGIIIGFIDFPENKVWRKIMSDDAIKIAMPAKEVGNTKKWLLESVAPALARELDLNESFMYEFMLAVEENREDS